MNTSIAIDVKLSEAQIAALADLAPGRTPTETVAGIAQASLEDTAAGGMMISPSSMARLRSSLVDPYDEEALVAAIEMGARKSGDAKVVSYMIDPIYLTPLADVAASNGMSLEDLVQNCLSSAFELGWFYEMNLDSRSIVLTVEQYNAIRSRIGREQIFGRDVAEWVAAAFSQVEMEEMTTPEPAQIAAPEVVDIDTLDPQRTSLDPPLIYAPEPGEPVNIPVAVQPEEEDEPEPEEEEVSLFGQVV